MKAKRTNALMIKDACGHGKKLSLGEILSEATSNRERGEHENALLLLEQAVRLAPSHPELRRRLGEAQMASGRFEEAISSLQQVVRADPWNAGFRLSLAQSLMAADPAQAVTHFLAALQLGSKEPQAFCDLASTLLGLRKEEEALKVCALGLHACPGSFEILGNHAVACRRLGLYEQALESCLRQRQQRPDDARVWSNLGNVLRDLGRLDESEQCLCQAILLDGANASAHYNMALTLLMAGHYRQGFQEYEWRWRTSELQSSQRTFAEPLWDGDHLAGRRLLLWSEQGAGDFIQFSRYVADVQKSGARVILQVPPVLSELARWLQADVQVTEPGSPVAFNVHCPLLSAPIRCQGNIDSVPQPLPFVIPGEWQQEWAQRLAPYQQRKVALIWAGSPAHKNDRNRSLTLQTLQPLFARKDIDFFSLQVGAATEQISQVGFSQRLTDLAPYCQVYADTAVAVSQMDLVITVDTSVAHLAGALGVPTWMLVPFAPDWRWLVNRTDSPWYPSLRLFRQSKPGDWGGVVTTVASELAAHFREKPSYPVDQGRR